jgi:hypothetical protein
LREICVFDSLRKKEKNKSPQKREGTQLQPEPNQTETNPNPSDERNRITARGSMDGSHANAAAPVAGGGEGTQRTL